MAKKQLTLEEKIQNALVPEEEQPFKVPENWCWTRLGSVGSIILGQSPRRDDTTEDDSCIPLLSGVAEPDDGTVTVKKYVKAATKVSQLGDLLISMKNNLGKSVIADKEYCLGRGVAAFRSDIVDVAYARYWLLNSKNYLYENATGTSTPQISGKVLQNMPIPFPPLEEQKRIVSVFESSWADLERARALIESVLDGTAIRKKSIINGGVTGQLTSIWRKIKGISKDDWRTGSLDSSDIYKSFRNWLKQSQCVNNQSDDVQVSVPTPPEQQEIASIIRNLLAKENTVVTNCNNVLHSIEIIKKAINASAFCGELGTNDPTEKVLWRF
ncbi:MAG: restriction endonuclease subunit S [Anaerovibrio sp.]|uniref:restriction endonuclease subunit S n=1 Tax=Anaerovibrio sp. TaxID=1872532 RepID=UPI0025D8C7E2|nr:restriction endonuclease subunit S [Anaerovibrio sp.]MCR5175874.1 restriction endonuclease subunit S [Anaerovibrio sp.]